MNRIDRLLGILTLLQSRRYVPAEKITEHYGITERTMYRDIRAITDMGVPVSFEQGRGYFVVQGYYLPPVSFSNEEASALLLMETLVDGFADRSVQAAYKAALTKIRAGMRGSQKDKMERLKEATRLQVPPCFRQDQAWITVLQDAIVEKTIIELWYRNAKDEPSQRRVEPIGLVFYALQWHLIAWCHLRGEYRDFRVTRIADARNTGRPFEQETHMPLEEYMQQLPVDY